MKHFTHLPARRCLALAVVCAILGPAAARAADHGHEEHAKPAAVPAHAAAPASAASSASVTPAAALKAVDPLTAVRDKIAQRLGATVQGQEPGSATMRVAARPAPAAAAAHGSHVAPIKNIVHKTAHADAGASEANAPSHAHWSYGGESGPQAWGAMKPEFAKCSTGTRQSPIDIRGGIGVELEPIAFDYRASGFAVIDNGHTVQVNVGAGNSIEILGRRYELLQFHFHRPSEERIDGRQFDMVAHLVHKDLEGRLAVVAVLLDRGSAQPLIQTVWNNLPLEKGEELPARARIDLNHLLPQDRRYYTYMGSLTTPPCSEGVLWMVMQQPVAISPEQIDIFARLYPMNARSLQSSAGRLIKRSN
jgi:carbonic anhydrase